MKNIGILGSTGSIGTQALEIIRMHPDKFNVVFLSAHSNLEALKQQAVEFNPDLLHIYNNSKVSNNKI